MIALKWAFSTIVAAIITGILLTALRGLIWLLDSRDKQLIAARIICHNRPWAHSHGGKAIGRGHLHHALAGGLEVRRRTKKVTAEERARRIEDENKRAIARLVAGKKPKKDKRTISTRPLFPATHGSKPGIHY